MRREGGVADFSDKITRKTLTQLYQLAAKNEEYQGLRVEGLHYIST
jgi:hypothetical protein